MRKTSSSTSEKRVFETGPPQFLSVLQTVGEISRRQRPRRLSAAATRRRYSAPPTVRATVVAMGVSRDGRRRFTATNEGGGKERPQSPSPVTSAASLLASSVLRVRRVRRRRAVVVLLRLSPSTIGTVDTILIFFSCFRFNPLRHRP